MTTSYTRDRGYTRARRMSRDEEEGTEQLREMLNDPDLDLADLIAAAIEHAPENKREGMYDALRELGEDRRGPRSWAADRLERRWLGRDMRERRGRDRRMGRDLGSEQLTAAESPRIEDWRKSDEDRRIEEGEDRRRMGNDRMALDNDRAARSWAERVFGPPIERF